MAIHVPSTNNLVADHSHLGILDNVSAEDSASFYQLRRQLLKAAESYALACRYGQRIKNKRLAAFAETILAGKEKI